MGDTTTSPLDLVDVLTVKSWLKLAQTTTDDDDLIQLCITGWSTAFLHRTGRGDQNQDLAQSPFTAVCTFNEAYDGMGTSRLFLRNYPITTVITLTVNGINIAQSSGYNVQGYVIDGSAKSIALRSGLFGWSSPSFYGWGNGTFRATSSGLKFWKGIQNVTVQYKAGYAETPLDIQECAMKVVAQNYKRRDWIDQATRQIAGGGGSTTYRNWVIPPECQDVVDRYTRSF